MIRVDIRDNNRIIVLEIPGKVPIRARQGSPYFHTSMELLCVAIGSCIGNHILRLCWYEKIDPKIFQSINIDLDDFKPKVIVQIPSDLNADFKKALESKIKNCEIASMLKESIEVEFILNDKPVEELKKVRKCCGE